MLPALLAYVGLVLRLNGRNRMALVYGYLFPLIFLAAFRVIYRAEPEPLALHLGELLTVTVLGGACFGLPTTLVSERERGVWRLYRATPMPALLFVGGVAVARLLLLASAAVLQLLVAAAIGMPAPAHPLALAVAFLVAAGAFVGLGLVVAMLADTVPAVQALGQCLFLPMLMIGGVAVRLASLPAWAQHLSAFFPGRYAVAAIQAATTGPGLLLPPLAALLVIGASAGAAGLLMFRWDAGAPAPDRRHRPWLLLALAGWLAVGLAAERRGAALIPPLQVPVEHGRARDYLPPAPPPAPAAAIAPARPRARRTTAFRPAPRAAAIARPAAWQAVTADDWNRVDYARLPDDQGLVSPIATVDEALPEPLQAQYDAIARALPDWPPGRVADPVQRARNLLYVAGVPDALQMTTLERFLPVLVYGRLRAEFGREQLPRLLYWIATHPNEGEAGAARDLAPLGLPATPVPEATARTRAMLYAFKLLGRATGAIVQR